jgi:long-subunit acyl-CoA synthetase (AMP-forming)
MSRSSGGYQHSRESRPSHSGNSASHVSVSTVGRAPVDDIVSRYVLNSALPSERTARVQRSSTPPTRSTNAVLNSSGLVYSPTTNRYTDVRRSDQQLTEMRQRMEKSNRTAEEVAHVAKELERSRSLLSELEIENTDLRSKVRSLSILVEEKERGIREVETSLRSARQSLAETEELRVQDMTTLRHQIKILQQENSELATRCDNLRSSITNRGGELTYSRDELRKKLEQLEIQLDTSRNTNFRLNHQLEEKEHLLDELHRLQSEIPRLESDAKDSMLKLQDAQKMIQQKEEERMFAQEKHMRHLRDLSEQLNAWKRESSRQSDQGFEHHQLQSETSSRTSQKDQEILSEISNSVRTSMDELRRRQLEVERLQIDIDRLKDENRILRETASSKDFLHSESTLLKSQVKQLEENINLLQQLNTDLKSQLSKRESAAAAESSSHLEQVEQLRKELASAKGEVATLDSLKKENQKLRKEVTKGGSSTSERVNDLRAEKTVLEQEVTDLREKLIGMTANAIQVERIYAEQIDDLQKEVTHLKQKEADCRANHLNPEREHHLRTRTDEIETENETLRQKLEANIKLQEELASERRKELIKREQQDQLQQQLNSLSFGKHSASPSASNPNNLSSSSPNALARSASNRERAVPQTAADIYTQRMQRAGAPPPVPPTSTPPPRQNTEELSRPASPLHRMTSTMGSRTAATGPPDIMPSTSSFFGPRHVSFTQGGSQPLIPASGNNSPRDFDTTQMFSSDKSRISSQAAASQQQGGLSGVTSVPKVPILYTDDGVGSIRFGTVPQLFFAAAESGGGTVAMKVEGRGRNGGGDSAIEWHETTWQDYYVKAAQFAKALISHRCEPNSAVMIVSSGSTEACTAFCGAILAGCLPMVASPQSSSPHLLRQIEETAAEIIVVDDVELLQRLLSTTRRFPFIKQFVMSEAFTIPIHIRGEFGQMVATFDQFTALCSYVTDTMLQTRIECQTPETAACISYTPATTGDPKGVLLSHDNLQFAAAALAQAQVLTDHDSVSHLSLASISQAHGLVASIILPMITVASKGMPFVTHFVHYNGDTKQLPGYFRAIRPTFLLAATPIYQDIITCIQTVEQESRSDGDVKLQAWAKNVSREASFQRQRDIVNRIPTAPIKGAHLAASMNDKIKSALGLDRVVQTICAGGPVPMPILEKFASAGFDLLQVYSSTETTGLAAASAEACFQFGTCGFPLPCTEWRLDTSMKPNDRNGFREGELMIRGRHVMIGYLTSVTGSASGPNSEGWWRTGDLARIDNDTGLLSIVGRLRDQVVVYPAGSGSPSDKISPQRVEQEILRICPALSHVVVYGDQRKFLVALMTLRARRNIATGTFTDDLAGEALEVNPEVLTVTTARRDDKWLKYIAGVIAQCNSIADSSAMKVKRFCILPSDFTLVGGELTSASQVRRTAVLQKYSTLVEKLYADDGGATPRK